MSLQVLNAHTGQRLSVEATDFASLDAFRAWLAQASSLPLQQQILLTPAGKQVKFPALTQEHEIFVYSRQLIAPRSSPSTRSPNLTIPQKPLPQLTTLPDADGDQIDLKAWQRLFDARKQWARDLLEKSQVLVQDAHAHFDAIHIIERGVGVALGNLQAHVGVLEQKHAEAHAWSRQATHEHDAVLASYGKNSAQLASLPAKRSLIQFLPTLRSAGDDGIERRGTPVTLAEFADDKMGQDASDVIKDATAQMMERTAQLGEAVKQVVKDASDLVTAFEHTQAQILKITSNDAAQVMEEIEVFTKKLESDYAHILGLSATSKSMLQASKTGMLHARSHLPTLGELYTELGDVLRQVIEQRNLSISTAVKSMQHIAAIEAQYAHTNNQIVALDLSKEGADALDKVALLSQLPLVYGALLIEAVRRREWSDKLRSESAVLAEDIAGYREEEDRRRKKWFKSFGHLMGEEAGSGTALHFELNLHSEGEEWPEFGRDDISEYMSALQSLDDVEDVVAELSEAFKDLERPTKRQVKRAKGFKMGSLHEAESGNGSFLLRGNEEVKILRDVNSRLEEELKSQRSRVRRLEDLVYKQGQPARTAPANMFGAVETQRVESPLPVIDAQVSPIPSPKPADILSRQASMNSRRASGNKSADEKMLARRIVTLEAELHDERQKRQELEAGSDGNHAGERHLRQELEEVNCTNRDLMANMEAKHREFGEERHILAAELARHKQRLEELEDDIDRVLGSRDNDKSTFDEKIRLVQTELEDAREEVAQLHIQLKHRDETVDDYTRSLRFVHSNLSSGRPTPLNIAELINELDELAERSGRHAKELSQALASAKSDKDALQSFLNKHEEEAAHSQTKIKTLEDEATRLRSSTSIQKAKSDSLATELEDGRQQLRILRAKFADGETGSESLRQRLEQQASKASTLGTELAEAKSQLVSLDGELSSLQSRQLRLQMEASDSAKRLEHRSARDRELTHRLAARNEELGRLLEALGLTIIEREGTMAIHRTSKLTGSASLPEQNLNLSVVSATDRPYDITIPTRLLSWMQAETEEEENANFGRFIAQVDTFNTSRFSEAIVKLRRDVEWTGKKWKAEARSYRDKFHRAQSEAHDKIAFRSFREGDLALFLPTRNQATKPWAAFNVGAPHYFLKEQDSHKLQQREWLVARISKVEERVVDLSRTMESGRGSDGRSIGETSEGGASFEDDNPFELSDGLRWYLLEAAEEKSGAPSTPGLGKSTVASANVDAKGSIRMKKSPAGYDASTKLNKSLESRRSSSNSKRGSISSVPAKDATLEPTGITGLSPTPVVDIPRVISQTHLPQPPFGATVTSASSGLGIEIDNQDITEEWANGKAAAATPSKASSLLNVFRPASPSKPSWSTRQPSRVQVNPESPASLPRDIPSSFKAVTPIHHRPELRQRITSPFKRTVTQQQDQGYQRASPSKSDADLPTRSASVSPNKKAPIPAWESLWSLDMSIEGGKGTK